MYQGNHLSSLGGGGGGKGSDWFLMFISDPDRTV